MMLSLHDVCLSHVCQKHVQQQPAGGQLVELWQCFSLSYVGVVQTPAHGQNCCLALNSGVYGTHVQIHLLLKC